MSDKPILIHRLDNGLILQCLDESKKIAGDRWYICIRVRVDVPVEKKWFDQSCVDVDEDGFQQIRRRLGQTVIFEQKKDRNFIDDDQKESIVKKICDSAVDTGMKYIGHADFAAKFILKQFNEHRHTA